MALLQSRPALRWLVPLLALFIVVGGFLLGGRAVASPTLPAKSPQELLVAVQRAMADGGVKGLSGTVVQEANLGIPEIPGAGDRSSDFNTLIAGSHTLLVWYAGPDKARVALKGTLGESDLIVNGSDVWTWSSEDNSATHRTLDRSADQRQPEDLPKTPQEAAQRALAALDDSTSVATDPDVSVAGRAAYELVLTPKDEGSLIRQVRIAVDGETYVPLRVQVFGSAAKPALQVGYTSIDFAVPDDAQFAFNPPEGTKIKELTGPTAAQRQQADKAKKQAEKKAAERAEKGGALVVGQAWGSVLVTKVGSGVAGSDDEQLQGWLTQLPRESGAWGSGRVLRGTAFTAVLTDDGRLAVGAVTPERVFAALR